MPAGIYPLAFAQHEDLCDAADLVDVLAAGFEFVSVVRAGDCGEAIDLNFGFGKLEFDKPSVRVNIDNLMSQDYG